MRAQSAIGGLILAALAMTAEAAEDRLTPLLRFVPPAALAGPQDAVSFVDLAAVRSVLADQVSPTAMETWSEADRALATLMRATNLPPMLADYAQNDGASGFAGMEAHLGFGWDDVERAIGFGAPPATTLVLAGTPRVTDAAAIGEALAAGGFAVEEREGHPFWWRLSDNASDLASRDPSHPLRGAIGGSARAGILSEAFVAAGNWAAIDAVLAQDAAAGTSPDLAALAHALNQPVAEEGVLLQAYLMPGAVDLAPGAELAGRTDLDDEALAALRERLLSGEGSGVPRYRAVAFGDRQEGDRAVAVVALLYDSEEAAQAAAEAVPAAMAALQSTATSRPYTELLPYAVAAQVVHAGGGGGRHLALITFSTELAPVEGGPLTVSPAPYRRLIDMLYRRDLGFLAPAH